MAVPRKKLIDRIFLEAADLPPAEALRHVEQACGGDAALIGEVQALLASDRAGQGSVEKVVFNAAADFSGERSQEVRNRWIGRRLGAYSIVAEIGHGGMGTVYRAVRADDQYRRSVAIKVIAKSFHTAEDLARFRTERQILATLQHPNIAALLDGGETEDGVPYIVMEYIDGKPLIEYCNEAQLGVAERLELFRALCSAVQHAHRMLVIHRDIKPGNVIVTSGGVPKLLDFGIAKLIADDDAPGDATRTANRVLTPGYASPEHIRGESLTTSSDVYSLGVLLYELLSSHSPYRTTGKTPGELARSVCESEPIRLSAAVSKDPKLRKQLAGDLENIVAMALRKDPARRYGSVQRLSEDLGRFLQGLPVSARDETLWYVAGKLVRRNKLASAAFVLLAISIVLGWALTIREHRRTQARFEEVRRMANTMLFDVSRDVEALPGSTGVREKLVRTGLKYLSGLSADAAGDLSLLWDVSQAYERIGDVQGDPDGPNLGQTREALGSYRKAMAIVETLARERADYETLSCLTWLHYKCGDLELRVSGATRALEDYGKGLAVAARVGSELKHDRTDDLLREGYQRASVAQMQSGLRRDAVESARKASDAATRSASKHPGPASEATVAGMLGHYANVLSMQGDLSGAIAGFERAIRTYETLIASDPGSTSLQQDLAMAYRRLGDIKGNPAHFHTGEMKQAEEYQRKSVAILEKMASRDERDAKAQSRYAVSLRRLAAVLREDRPQEAVGHYQHAIAISEGLLRASPGDRALQREAANHRSGLAHALRNLGQYDAARQQAQAAIDMQKAIAQTATDNIAIREDLVDAQLALAQVWLAENNAKAALGPLNEALWTARLLAEKDSASLYTQRCMALVSRRLGDCHAALGNKAESRRWYDEAASVWSRWKRENLARAYAERQEAEVLRARAASTN